MAIGLNTLTSLIVACSRNLSKATKKLRLGTFSRRTDVFPCSTMQHSSKSKRRPGPFRTDTPGPQRNKEEVVREGGVWQVQKRLSAPKKGALGPRRDEEEVVREEGVWRKTILMGEKCQPLDFSGVIHYDGDGNRLEELPTPRSPLRSPRPMNVAAFGFLDGGDRRI